MPGEAAKDASGRERTGGQDGFGNFARGTIVPEKDDPFLREHGVGQDNDGVGMGPAGREMGMQHERLGRRGVRSGEDLDEFDEREIAHGFGKDARRDLDGDGDLIVDDLGFEFMRIPGRGIFGTLRRPRE